MEGQIFWVLAGAVLVLMIRQTKRKARAEEIQHAVRVTYEEGQPTEPDSKAPAPSFLSPHSFGSPATSTRNEKLGGAGAV